MGPGGLQGMLGAIVRGVGDTARGVGGALRGHPGTFLGAGLAVLALSVLLPPLVLSLARKPVDYFTFNPWLKRLPEYLASGGHPLGTRIEKTWGLVLFWFSADNPYGVEWGFSVTVADLARFLLLALLVGAYFALWRERRARVQARGLGVKLGRPGGVLAALTGALGLSTAPCTVMGCGAPVLPVLGLAFVGLSSTTLKWMAEISAVATTALLGGLVLVVGYLGSRLGARRVSSSRRERSGS
ncbi:MAG TPA: hypothetical protein DDZ42_13480 [Candidatus Rokubacteria bacterium]|nr:MAG: hypothetical protein A2050_11250 [Candidatus Rokubacteria bacterium GWA2_73_35]HBH02911.1 hypothetical protein [Candidatus Rokubacteria bacterium]